MIRIALVLLLASPLVAGYTFQMEPPSNPLEPLGESVLVRGTLAADCSELWNPTHPQFGSDTLQVTFSFERPLGITVAGPSSAELSCPTPFESPDEDVVFALNADTSALAGVQDLQIKAIVGDDEQSATIPVEVGQLLVLSLQVEERVINDPIGPSYDGNYTFLVRNFSNTNVEAVVNVDGVETQIIPLARKETANVTVHVQETRSGFVDEQWVYLASVTPKDPATGKVGNPLETQLILRGGGSVGDYSVETSGAPAIPAALVLAGMALIAARMRRNGSK